MPTRMHMLPLSRGGVHKLLAQQQAVVSKGDPYAPHTSARPCCGVADRVWQRGMGALAHQGVWVSHKSAYPR